jgi:hypothetical protein
MRRVFIIYLFILSFSSEAQNWVPFQSGDTLNHFLTKYGLGTPSLPLSQVQSVFVDSSYIDGTTQVRIFKRGFSPAFFHTSTDYNQIIKGQVLGDTVRIYNDSSVFSSIDESGYHLVFPHTYYQGQRFQLAKSDSASLFAVVDTLFTDSVQGIVDSLVVLKLLAFDNMGTIDTTHSFHGATLKLSKNNGLIETVDFTNLDSKQVASRFFMNKNFFTKREQYSLSVGDEYHYTLDSTIPAVRYYHTMEVINETLTGSERKLTYLHKWQKRYPGSPTLASIMSDTVEQVFNDTSIAFSTKSLIVEDTLQAWSNYYLDVQEFSICEACGFTPLLFEQSIYNVFSMNLGKKRDSVSKPSALSGSSYQFMIGIDYNYHIWGNSGIGFDQQTKQIVFVKRGNKSWGTPLNLVTSIKELKENKKSVYIYPNPSSSKVFIHSESTPYKLELSDAKGNLIELKSFSKSFNTSNLHPGVYFLKIYTKEGVFNQKLLKQ